MIALIYICNMLYEAKIKIVFLFVFYLHVLQVNAQYLKFEDAMKHSLMILDSAKTNSGLKKAALDFIEISNKEKKEWLPYYYTGICYVIIAMEKKGKETDKWCDKAEFFSKKADSLNTNNSEIKVLKSMIASARIATQKLQRGQKYAALAMQFADEAIKLNPKNPRAFLQKATIVYYIPEIFGGGAKKAKPHAELAVEKFNTFKRENAISPDWGKSRAEKLLKECLSASSLPKK